MVKSIWILALLTFSLYGFGQQDTYFKPGLISASATIAPSKMLNRSVSNTYLSGFLAYQLDSNFSFRGDGFWFVNDNSSKENTLPFIDKTQRFYFGIFYHLEKNNWDKYIGFQPGITLMQISDQGTQANPSFALHIGTTYYVWKYFHFFADLTYVNSSLHGIPSSPSRTDELIFSGGLGFHFSR